MRYEQDSDPARGHSLVSQTYQRGDPRGTATTRVNNRPQGEGGQRTCDPKPDAKSLE